MRRQLAQLRPSGTSAVSLFSPDNQYFYTVDLILATNNSGSSVDVTIYHDSDGTTYDDTTCILATTTLSAGDTLDFSPGDGDYKGISDYQSAGSIGVKTSAANSVNFTAYGVVEGERK